MKCKRCGGAVTQNVVAKSTPKGKQYTTTFKCIECGFNVSATSDSKNESNKMLIREWNNIS